MDQERNRDGGAGGEPREARRSPARAMRTFTSAEIFADAREVLIEHGEGLYRLRATRNGKLILTK